MTVGCVCVCVEGKRNLLIERRVELSRGASLRE